MFRINVVGKFKGADVSSADEGKTYIYIEPDAPVPAGLLGSVRLLNRNSDGGFMEASEVKEQLGMLAIEKDADVPDGFNLNETVSLTALCWPTTRPIWGEKNKEFWYNQNEVRYTCQLEGEIKRGGERGKKPFGVEIAARAKFKRFHGEKEALVRLELEDEYPLWFGEPVQVKCKMRGPRGFMMSMYKEGKLKQAMFGVVMSLPESNKVTLGEMVTLRGDVWPVSVPYWSEEENRAMWLVIPQMRVIAKSVEASKSSGGNREAVGASKESPAK